MKIKVEKDRTSRQITLEGDRFDDLLAVAREQVQEAELQGWKVTDVSVYSTRLAPSVVGEDGKPEPDPEPPVRGYISLEREG